MLSKPIALPLLKEDVVEPVSGCCGKDNVGKRDRRLTQLQKTFQIAPRAREGDGDAGPDATRGPRRIDRCSNLVGRVAPPLTRFRRSDLKGDGEKLFLVSLGSATKHRNDLFRVRHNVQHILQTTQHVRSIAY